jgi:hypothetical protein
MIKAVSESIQLKTKEYWMNSINKCVLAAVLVGFSGTVLAKPWHVHNETDQEYSMLWIADGCAKIHYCGSDGNNHSYVCKKQKVPPNEEVSYKWDGSGKSNKKLVICTTDGGSWQNSDHQQTYICPKDGKDQYSNWELKGGSCDG